MLVIQSGTSALHEDQQQLSIISFNQKKKSICYKQTLLSPVLISAVVLGWRKENVMDQNSLTCIYKQPLLFPGAQGDRINKYEMQSITRSEVPQKTW